MASWYDITKAKNSLNITNSFGKWGEDPSTEEEYLERIKWVDYIDSDGNDVYTDKPLVTWNQVIELGDGGLAEMKLNSLRVERNRLIAETDWWELPTHAPMSAERTAYRKALRDITKDYKTLDDVEWPTKPE